MHEQNLPDPSQAIHLLLLEDEPTSLRLLEVTLASAPLLGEVRVTPTASLAEALEALPGPPFDLAVIDLSLPDASALEPLERMRAVAPRLPIVVLTGRDDEELAMEALRAGAQDYLVKAQVSPPEMIRAVRYALERSRSERALFESEARIQLVLDTSTDGVVYVDADGIVEFANRAAGELLGISQPGGDRRRYDDPRWQLRTLDGQAVAPDGYPFARVLRANAPVFGMEHLLRHSDGRDLILSINGAPIRSAEGHPVGMVATLRDVTEERRAEAEGRRREALEAQLREAQKLDAIGRLTGGVAHDFNNLIAAMKGYVELLRERTDLDEEVLDDLGEINAAVDRASGLTRQLLTFSRRQVIEPTVFEPGQVVKDMMRMLARVIPESVELVTHLETTGGRVLADRGQLEQVLLNLVLNARDAMPDGGLVTLSTRTAHLGEAEVQRIGSLSPGRHVILEVTDDGVGIAPENLPRIFEPFFTTKEAGRGTGLGLSTVRHIVQQAGGEVQVESAPGRGATFRIHLPCTDEDEAAAGASAPETTTPGRGERILVVEDSESLRRLVTRILGRRGYEVVEAQDGEAALALDPERRFDLLLTDVVMPRMSGVELARRLRERQQRLRVLYMSGYADNVISEQGLSDAGTALLHKPFDPGELLHRVRAILDAARA